MVKKKALGQDPFKKELFPWIKSTEDEKGEEEIVLTNTQTTERPNKQSLPSKQGLQNKQSLQSNHETLRQTYHLSADNVEKIKQYAYIERLKISEVVNKALGEFFENKKFTM